MRRPRKCGTNATRDPTLAGVVSHVTEVMFTYQLGAFSGSLANEAASLHGASISIEVSTSIAMSRD